MADTTTLAAKHRDEHRDERRHVAAAEARAIKDDTLELAEIRAIQQDMAELHQG